MVEPFNAFETELETGTNLLEASAGTGKTFSLVMLVVRFVVEKRIPLEQILVVTFTRAATRELKWRVRERLQELQRLLRVPEASDTDETTDPVLQSWVDALDDQDGALKHVGEALAMLDEAAIFTIHGFCQRTLRQFALETGQLFDAELADEEDIEALKLSVLEDYWRKTVYPANALLSGIFSQHGFDTPQALKQHLNSLQRGIKVVPDALDLDAEAAVLEQCVETRDVLHAEVLKPLQTFFSDHGDLADHFKKGVWGKLHEYCDVVRAWLADASQPLPIEAVYKLSAEQLAAGLNGAKFRAQKKTGLSSEERKSDFLRDALKITATPHIDALLEAIDRVSMAFLAGAITALGSTLRERQLAQNIISNDDLILRLADAMDSPQGPLLKHAIRNRYQVALIDEFQDTDPAQWSVFSAAFADSSEHFLYLVGDPKQAIYRFRGADIHAYLQAQQASDHRYSLATNFRSQHALVEGVNKLFEAVENPFRMAEIDYHSVSAHRQDTSFWQEKDPANQFALRVLDAQDMTQSAAWETLKQHIVSEVVALLNPRNSYRLSASEEESRALQTSDIAVLVRGNRQAQEINEALSASGVPSVINSRQSVFATDEALDLYHLLRAIMQPGVVETLRRALTIPWLGLDGPTYLGVVRDEAELQNYMSDFQEFLVDWQQQDVMFMMRRLLEFYKVRQTLASQPLAERRISNIHHLLEILQKTVHEQRLDREKSVQWLYAAIQRQSTADGVKLRLERDDEAVTIMTVHGSKGLEYPIVFCADLWREGRKIQPGDLVTCHSDEGYIVDLGSADIGEHKARQEEESAAEELRLSYVALTRASERCYIYWLNKKLSESVKKSPAETQKQLQSTALAKLLAGFDGEDNAQRLESIAERHPDLFSFVTLPSSVHPGQYQSTDGGTKNKNLGPRIAYRQIEQRWRMSSYSALTARSTGAEPAPLIDQELPGDKSDEPEIEAIAAEEAIDDGLPRGRLVGNALHDLLENNTFESLAGLDDQLPEDYIQRRSGVCIKHGLNLNEVGLSTLDTLLQRTVSAPLDADDEDFCLKNIPDSACLKEMPFYFSVDRMQTERLDKLLANHPSVAPLSRRSMSGQLTGYIDLICEYQGRFYVMDYKSNTLPAYGADELSATMKSHNYGLQYLLYSLVLHHYLQQRKEDYDFEQHFGGVRYLFLRGMNPDQPMQGVFADRPEQGLLEDMSDVLVGVAA